MIKALFKSFEDNEPDCGYWDQTLLWDTFKKIHIEIVVGDVSDDTDGVILVISGRQNFKRVNEINRYMARFRWVILVVTGDEENVFPINEIRHGNITVYQQTPRSVSGANRYIPLGYTPSIQYWQPEEPSYVWSFIGQVNHRQREEWIEKLGNRGDGNLIRTKGFAQGLNGIGYIKMVGNSKTVPAPSGPVIPETFRMYEALEVGALPIVSKSEYWDRLFDSFPIPQIESADELEGNVEYFADTYPARQNEASAWWQQQKMKLKWQIEKDIEAYTAIKTNRLSVIIPTSPIKSHPDTYIINETLKSLELLGVEHEVFLLIDGVRSEQQEYYNNYQIYIRNLLRITNKMGNVFPVIFKGHRHQVGMTKFVLDYLQGDFLLFVEHDTPLCEFIPSETILKMLSSGAANVVRLNHEALVLPEHERLYLSGEINIDGEKFRKTAQWSQRPHFARVDFYRKMLNKYFSANALCMIEDGVHGNVARDFEVRGRAGWDDWRVWMYTPEKDQKRSYTLDGRKGDPKFDETFIY